MPPRPDRTSWLNLNDANEAAKEAYKEKQPTGSRPSQEGGANVQTTAVGDLSIEVEVSPDSRVQDRMVTALTGTCCHSGRPGLDDERGRDEEVGLDAGFLTRAFSMTGWYRRIARLGTERGQFQV